MGNKPGWERPTLLGAGEGERGGAESCDAPPSGPVWWVPGEARLVQVSQGSDTLNEGLEGSVRQRGLLLECFGDSKTEARWNQLKP